MAVLPKAIYMFNAIPLTFLRDRKISILKISILKFKYGSTKDFK
jgi:hypothetical protein